ncbi:MULTISPECIES: alpha-amylase family glycosyl hydrolase [Salipiger]|jgi:alpha-glucosidase|uniref:Alpha-glucosidase n=1 Tax=Salipiger profundus TaxID=1229727 RepID=A0A1U7D7I3_9RHOB|nr:MULTISPECIES: alpha-amylase family glycosyl hydrolase [Salipiger]APX24083.1 alpha-glucosidase [Salipiger profundus]GFZ94538.1 alpha-glucosidase [Salipiger profundus]SFB91657.1 alpha-glucosidase [Salipiger profundus]
MSGQEGDAQLAYAIAHLEAPPDPPEWWRGAVFYEIYIRSFNDASGDGLGDINGITEKLDYLAGLGVDGIWLAPPYASPQDDNGYDISDFKDIDPIFGTVDDLKILIDKCHDAGLKILLDLVMGHSSDQHPWFIESASSRDNDKADWYVWADPAPDGGPPNNWLSSFGGRAWRWEPRRAQYCYRPFLRSQPALNLANQEVLAAMLDVMRFWLDLGVDGFRVDAVQCLSFDAALRSNPAAIAGENPSLGGGPNNPFGGQMHLFDRDVPRALPLLHHFRRVADEYEPERVLIGELADVDSSRLAPKYTVGDDRLHAVYDFDLINRADTVREWRKLIDIRSRYLVPGTSLNVFTNHDSPRAVSNLMPSACAEGRSQEAAKLLLFLQATLAGGMILFQGDELGLEQPDLSAGEITDPWARALWPDFEGRDGVRCPLPWKSETLNAGFSDADTPWKRARDSQRESAVDVQEDDPDSVLHFTRELLAWRRSVPMLRIAAERVLPDMPDGVIGVCREHAGEALFVYLNFGLKQVSLPLSEPNLQAAFSCGHSEVEGDSLTLGSLSGVVLRKVAQG